MTDSSDGTSSLTKDLSNNTISSSDWDTYLGYLEPFYSDAVRSSEVESSGFENDK